MAQRTVDYAKLERASRAGGLFGTSRRRRAVGRLAELRTPQAVPALCHALSDREPGIAATARAALAGLADQGAKDALCGQWAKSRDEALAAIMVEGRHVAAKPSEVRVLSALKTGVTGELRGLDWAGWEALATAVRDRDAEIAERASDHLGRVRKPETLDRLCEYLVVRPESPLREAALRFGWRHSDVAADCLFLFMTDQWEEYFAQDMDCQYVAEQYRQADDDLRGRIRQKVATQADQRLVRILRTSHEDGPAQTDTATSDLNVAIAVAERNKNYHALFDMVLRGRFTQIMDILGRLTKAGWEPEEEVERRFYKELLGHYRPLAILAQQPDSKIGVRGLEGLLTDDSLARVSEEELRQRTGAGAPLSRARALMALASRGAKGMVPLVEAFATATDWTMRMAAMLVAPAVGASLSGETIESALRDRVHQLGAAAMQALLVGGLSGRTPADIERLQGLIEAVGANLQAQQGAKEEATRVLELMLCVLRHRIRDIVLKKRDEAEPTYQRDDIRILKPPEEE